MLVVLVIIGILVLIALPNLMPLISKAKAMEAQQQLAFVHTLQKSYFYTYSRYSDSLDEIGFEQRVLGPGISQDFRTIGRKIVWDINRKKREKLLVELLSFFIVKFILQNREVGGFDHFNLASVLLFPSSDDR